MHLLSAPEGLAFDSNGNLWLGNNNDFNATNGAGEGTLVKINGSWINGTLLNSPAANSYTVPTAQASVKYIPNAKIGGIAISGNKLYINDQGQAQGSSYLTNGTVWRYDATTTFNSTNFAASGIRTTYPGNGQMSFVASIPAASTKLYVNANAVGSNNGSSWANAYTNLQTALLNSTLDSVFVALGTYKPSSSPVGCTNCVGSTSFNTFTPISNKKVFGGFLGTEKWLTQRAAIGTNISYLNGDLSATSSDDASHVLLLYNVSGVWIEGFTLQNGAAYNGCVDMNLGSTNIVNQGKGGGLYAAEATATFNKCTFSNNACGQCSGGSGGVGGAVYSYHSTLTFNKCVLQNNNAGSGGAMYHEAQAVPYLNDCTFYNNYALGAGGALTLNYSNGAISRCIFDANQSTVYGGAIYMQNNTGSISNTVFTNNTLVGSINGYGGAIYADGLDGNAISNCTFYNNRAEYSGSVGAAIYDNASVPPTASANMTNCIFWGNTTPNNPTDIDHEEIVSNNTTVATQLKLKNCLVRESGSMTNLINGGGNKIGASNDPYFTNPTNPKGADNVYATADDGLRLACIVSSALNAGTSVGAPATDIVGAARQGNPDIGAYESSCSTNNVFQSGAAACQSISQSNVSGTNWYHFIANSGIIASINPQGQNLGNMTASVSDPVGIIINGQTRYLGRSISLNSTVTPVSNYLLRLYFNDAEITEYQTATGQQNLTPSSFNVCWASGGTGCSATNFNGSTGGQIASPLGVATGEFGSTNQGFYLQIALNHFTLFAATIDSQNTLVGTETTNSAADANIYPNPTTNDVRIALTGAVANTPFSAQLFDVLGRSVTAKIPLQQGEATISLNGLPNALYTLIITQNDQVVLTKKVVKN